MAGKKLTFEQAMDRLETVVKALESGEGALDEAMALFEEGSKLAGQCAAMLDQAEQKVTQLAGTDGGEEIPFETEN